MIKPGLALASLLLVCALGSAVASDWHHPLYLAGDGYWRKRVPIAVQNGMGQAVAGAPVTVAIGHEAGQADLVGAAAEAARVVDAAGAEMLFAIYGPDGRFITKGPIPEGSLLGIPAECPPGGTATYFVYFDNPSAWPPPDCLEASYSVRNGDVEHGTGSTPAAWRHDAGDGQHEASWTMECAHSGARSLKLFVAEGAPPSWISTRQRGIYIMAGAHYVLRGWVKAQDVSGSAGWYLHVGNASNPMLLNVGAVPPSGTSYHWTEVVAEFDAPAEADRAEVGTMLWGSGVAWFDDVTLECTSLPSLTAAAGPVETRLLVETGVTAEWHDDGPTDDIHWDYRFPATVANLSDGPVVGLAQVDISPLLARRWINRDSIRVTSSAALLTHYQFGSSVLFEATVPARTAQTCYLYVSADPRVPPAAGDYAKLLSSPRNLVRNPSFEQGGVLPDGWLRGDALAGATLALDHPGLFGSRAARLSVPVTAEKTWYGWHQDVSVQPGKSYLYSAWAKCQEVSDGAFAIYAHYRNAAGELCKSSQYTDAGSPMSGTRDWTLMAGVFQMPQDCVTFQLHLTMSARGTAWHDGVVVAQVIPAVLGSLETRPERGAPGLAVWQVNAITKVFEDDPAPEQPQSVRISAARNEKEPLQLAVRSSTRLDGITVEVTPPTSDQGGQLTDITVGVVGCVPVDHPSGYYSSNLPSWRRRYPTGSGQSDGWPGWWPDPIVPRDGLDLSPNTTQAIWITVSVPKDARPGDYLGRVRLMQNGGALADLPFTVHVWDFTLPDERHLPAVYDIRLNHLWESPGKSMTQVRSDLEAFMSAQRVCPDAISPDPAITYRDGAVTADFAAFDAAAERYFNELKLPQTYTPGYFYCFGWGNPPREFAGEKPYPGEYPYSSADPSQLRPEYKAAYQACLRAYWEHMKARGWDQKVVLYLSDEPLDSNPRIIAQLKALAEMVHEVDPAMPIYVSTWRYIAAWDGYIDVWGIGHYGTVSPETMAQVRARGDRLRFTTDGQMCIDTPYLAVERLLPHYCFKYRVEAYEFWGVSWLVSYNPYEFGWFPYIHQSDQPGVSYYIRYPNGDGFLAYPGGLIGRGGPVSSLRLEQAREGVEDYEYLWLLQTCVAQAKAAGMGMAAGESALQRAQELVTIPNSGGKYSTQILPDPDAVLAAREELALAIEGLMQALGAAELPTYRVS